MGKENINSRECYLKKVIMEKWMEKKGALICDLHEAVSESEPRELFNFIYLIPKIVLNQIHKKLSTKGDTRDK